ncbi:hypothetical protein MRB53_034881 [Persea americana]|uniref:Uncharacterized protein n=1 Tax=Persea americana TaxID=3435 RepID=A0ACC2K3B2_PERAE|nr:hypothetical protein MRB53_034881 [Persea americana]
MLMKRIKFAHRRLAKYYHPNVKYMMVEGHLRKGKQLKLGSLSFMQLMSCSSVLTELQEIGDGYFEAIQEAL